MNQNRSLLPNKSTGKEREGIFHLDHWLSLMHFLQQTPPVLFQGLSCVSFFSFVCGVFLSAASGGTGLVSMSIGTGHRHEPQPGVIVIAAVLRDTYQTPLSSPLFSFHPCSFYPRKKTCKLVIVQEQDFACFPLPFFSSVTSQSFFLFVPELFIKRLQLQSRKTKMVHVWSKHLEASSAAFQHKTWVLSSVTRR